MKSETVNREKSLRVYLNDNDRKIIEQRANDSNLSISAYMRKAGLGLRPRSALDRAAAIELLKVNGDLGRLGGLLKLRLSEGGRYDAADIRDVLKKIDSAMDEIRRKAASV
ncbi:MAG: hypothetical protein J0L55_13975 [Caulobacterales bacterium]|nr:hypothetical protein [Caulobacterales bacterium]